MTIKGKWGHSKKMHNISDLMNIYFSVYCITRMLIIFPHTLISRGLPVSLILRPTVKTVFVLLISSALTSFQVELIELLHSLGRAFASPT